jgi:hypothetical protein
MKTLKQGFLDENFNNFPNLRFKMEIELPKDKKHRKRLLEDAENIPKRFPGSSYSIQEDILTFKCSREMFKFYTSKGAKFSGIMLEGNEMKRTQKV